MHRVNAIAGAHVAQIEGGKGGSLELLLIENWSKHKETGTACSRNQLLSMNLWTS